MDRLQEDGEMAGWTSGWSLRLTWWWWGGQIYQQTEGWVEMLVDDWSRGGGMKGEMEAQLDVKDTRGISGQMNKETGVPKSAERT